MKKVIFTIFICTLTFLSINVVNAKEVKNANGTFELTEKEYAYAKEFYGDNYFNRMNKIDYQWLKEVDVDNREVEIKKAIIPEVSLPNDTYVASNYKSLAISRSCTDTFCLVTVLADWLVNPTVRSYDVIGVRFYNGAALYSSNVKTRVGGDNTYQTFSNYSNFANGFGNTVKLPDNDTSLYVEQKLYTNCSGHVYASYQHAVRNTTLEVSKQYIISEAGYGSVFAFRGDAVDIYDDFAGVDIVL